MPGHLRPRRTLDLTSASRKFPKSKRLLRHADFEQVYENGRRQFTGNMTVFFLRRSRGEATDGDMRVGFTVGKVLGDSVRRNRIRRRMHEAVRSCWPLGDTPIDIVFNPRKSVLELPFAKLVEEVTRGIQLAMQRATEVKAKQP